MQKPTATSLPEAYNALGDERAYERSTLRRSIVHIGVGGFHRAHLAHYIHLLCLAGHTDWSITGAGVMPGDSAMADALSSQESLYSLIVRDASVTEVSIIASLVDYIHAHPDPGPLVDRIASPDTQIVSLTVTEGGYPIDDVTGEYQSDSPVSGADSAFGILALALEERRTRNGAPVTVLSCDNILGNGNAARASTIGEAQRHGSELVEWIERSVTFPNSMVDRITPATTDADRDWLADNHNLADRWPVTTEPFCQWVIEDHFAGDRLPLEELPGVIVTDAVAPYEHVKLRLLNAAHSCLAYLSALDGVDTVDQAMDRDYIADYVRAFLETEARPVVPPAEGIDLVEYTDLLIERFSNPTIGDQISRLCLDGSAKFPKFLLPTVRAQLQAGGPVDHCALALAGWCQYLSGTTLAGDTIELSPDPLLDTAIAHALASKDDPAAFLSFAEVFDAEVAESTRFVEAFTRALLNLRTGSVPAAIQATRPEPDQR